MEKWIHWEFAKDLSGKYYVDSLNLSLGGNLVIELSDYNMIKK